MKVLDIIEARRNPNQNPKTSINSKLISRANSASQLPDGTLNCFISFTEIEKLGINPKSKYETPIGVYAYSAEYVLDIVGETDSMEALPFAGGEPWANIFEIKGTVLPIANLTIDQSHDLVDRMAEYYEKAAGIESAEEAYIKITEYWLSSSDEAYVNTPGGELWYVTMKMAEDIAQAKSVNQPAAWNWLFRKVGIAAVYDSGASIIHANEPSQVVVFSSESITNIERVKNAYSPERMMGGQYLGSSKDATVKSVRQQLDQATTIDDIYYVLNLNGPEYINMIRDRNTRLKLMAKYPKLLTALSRPSPEDQKFIFQTLHSKNRPANIVLGSVHPRLLDVGAAADYLNHIGDPISKIIAIDFLTRQLSRHNQQMKILGVFRQLDLTTEEINKLLHHSWNSALTIRYLQAARKIK